MLRRALLSTSSLGRKTLVSETAQGSSLRAVRTSSRPRISSSTRTFASSIPTRITPHADRTMFDTSRLHNKVVLVTGASGGIGKATAVLFAKCGANVILTARRADALAEALKECEQANKAGGSGAGGKYATLELDMRDRKALDAVLNKLPVWAKEVDVLVNNAGLVLGVDKVGDIDADEIDVMIDTNVRGLIHLSQIFVKEFKKRDRGHVINVGSIAGREAYPGGSIYCATKFAVNAFTSALLKELVETPIRVTEIQPGMVETNFSVTRFRGDQGAAEKVYQGIQPLVGEDIAEEIVWAANRPPHVNIAESLIFPVNQASPYHRKK